MDHIQYVQKYVIPLFIDDAKTMFNYLLVVRLPENIIKKCKAMLSKREKREKKKKVIDCFALPNGWLHGFYSSYKVNADGDRGLIRTAFYVDGKKHGLETIYSYRSSEKIMQTRWRNDLIDGDSIKWGERGMIISHFRYKRGVKHGISYVIKSYSDDRYIKIETTYDNGIVVKYASYKCFYYHGKWIEYNNEIQIS
jgi:antitoxin component YwqK of YwqJK toxin-antitoxin module